MTRAYEPRQPRRMRTRAAVRALRRETTVSAADLIQPLFVREAGAPHTATGLPGMDPVSEDTLPEVAHRLAEAGIRAVLLFGIPARRDPDGEGAADPDGIVPRAVRVVRREAPALAVITDCCLCAWTSDGQCAHWKGDRLDHAGTLPLLGQVAVAHARAGADLVAPSGMLDGAVGAIREALDAHGFDDTCILAYAVKLASSLYGPFRRTADSAPAGGDRRSHQMDPANGREALLELALDADQGADMLMVKPASWHLDLVAAARREHPELPLAAFQVSGEVAALEAAARAGWLDRRAAVLESLVAIRRAGADRIITWWGETAARWLADADPEEEAR